MYEKLDRAKPYTKSEIIGIVGSKGNGKSLLLASMIIHKLIEGVTVWSNMPVKTSDAILARKYAPSGRPIKYAETKPLDWDLLYSLDESLVEGMIAIDEVGYQANSRESGSVRNRLVNACVRQSRHRNLDVLYTDRSFYRVDSRFREETDVIIECNDNRYSKWGKQNHVPGGYSIYLKFFDISGQQTGKSCMKGYYYDPSKYYKAYNWNSAAYLQCYDTRNIVSIDEFCSKVQLNYKVHKIGNDEEKESNEPAELITIAHKVSELKAQGIKSLKSWELGKMLNELGLTLTRRIRQDIGSLGIHYSPYEQGYLID
jgi:hypothetical protein